MNRSVLYSLAVGILLTIPIVAYQNFRMPEQIEQPTVTSDTTQILSPLPNQVVSMLEDHIFVWLDSEESYSGKIKITDDWGISHLEAPVKVESGESEHNLEVNESIRQVRDSWLYVELYKEDTLIARQKFGWGLIFLTAGQDNTANSQCNQCSNSPNPLKDVLFLSDSNNNSFETQEPGDLAFVPATPKSPMTDGDGQSVWYYLGEEISKRSNIPVAFINVGWSGTTLDQWLNGSFPRFQYGKYFKISGVLWHQGESDVSSTREDYRSKLFDLIEQTRREYQYEVPWFVSRASHCGKHTQYSEIVLAQTDVITGMGLTGIFAGPETDTLPHECHFDTKEQLNSYVESWYVQLKNSSLFGSILK